MTGSTVRSVCWSRSSAGFGSRMLTEFPQPVDVLEQAQSADPESSAAEELLPKDEAMSLALERRRNALETQLHNAVAEERYEDAAVCVMS